MAKRPELDNPFRKTGAEEPERARGAALPPPPRHLPNVTPKDDPLDEGRIISSGVGITQGELAYLDQLAEYYETYRNGLMHMAIRQFLDRVRTGEFDPGGLLEEPEEPPKRRYKRRL